MTRASLREYAAVQRERYPHATRAAKHQLLDELVTELEAVWGKGQQRVGSAVHYVRERLPVPLVGLDSDNGSEFINHRLYTWFQREGITFKRSAK